jgi:nucleoside-diphosphate-sugar epimerase
MDFSIYKDSKCVVTGGAGFIGGELRKRLLGLGAHAWCLDIKDGYVIDIRDIHRLSEQFNSWKPDYVFHLAALTEVEQSYKFPREYYSTNIDGTLNILEMCRLYKVKQVVVASSDKAYGERAESTLPYRECDVLLPSLDPYGNSKRLMDELCADYRRIYSLPLRTLRSANTYGPGQKNKTTLITNTVVRLMNGLCPVVHSGSMLKEREWIYIDDAIDSYLMAGVCDINCGGVWNVGSSFRASPIEVVREIMSIMHVEKIIEIQDSIVKRTGNQRLDSRLYTCIINAAHISHGTTHNFVDLEQGLLKTVEWYLKEYTNETPNVKTIGVL